jgi:hypothetical protein
VSSVVVAVAVCRRPVYSKQKFSAVAVAVCRRPVCCWRLPGRPTSGHDVRSSRELSLSPLPAVAAAAELLHAAAKPCGPMPARLCEPHAF